MPKLTTFEINRRAHNRKKLYIKHKGNKSRIAKELGVTPATMTTQFRNPVGRATEKSLENDVQKAAKKLGININWYLEKLKKGANNASKITGYINNKICHL